MTRIMLVAGFSCCSVFALCQEQSGQSVINININVSRSVPAVNYLTNSSTRIDFKDTPLLPFALGDAKVENKKGLMSLDASFSKMSPATQLGPEFRAGSCDPQATRPRKAEPFATVFFCSDSRVPVSL